MLITTPVKIFSSQWPSSWLNWLAPKKICSAVLTRNKWSFLFWLCEMKMLEKTTIWRHFAFVKGNYGERYCLWTASCCMVLQILFKFQRSFWKKSIKFLCVLLSALCELIPLRLVVDSQSFLQSYKEKKKFLSPIFTADKHVPGGSGNTMKSQYSRQVPIFSNSDHSSLDPHQSAAPGDCSGKYSLSSSFIGVEWTWNSHISHGLFFVSFFHLPFVQQFEALSCICYRLMKGETGFKLEDGTNVAAVSSARSSLTDVWKRCFYRPRSGFSAFRTEQEAGPPAATCCRMKEREQSAQCETSEIICSLSQPLSQV